MPAKSLTFEEASPEELTLIARAYLEKFGIDLKDVFRANKVIVSKNDRMEAFLVSKDVFKAYEVVKRTREPYFLGLYLGYFKGSSFMPSAEGITCFSDRLPSRKRVVVSEKAEQLFLYGRDVLKGSIVYIERNLRRGEYVAIVNERNEVLGIGKLAVDAELIDRLDAQEVVIENVFDKGWYLRRGG